MLRNLVRYQKCNPVRRGLVEKPKDWSWSSFLRYACGKEGIVGQREGGKQTGCCQEARVNPTLRKVREGWGTLSEVEERNENAKGWATRHRLAGPKSTLAS